MLKKIRQTIQVATGKIKVVERNGEEVAIEELGDGKAEFLGEGTHDEFEEQVKEDKGLKGIFGT